MMPKRHYLGLLLLLTLTLLPACRVDYEREDQRRGRVTEKELDEIVGIMTREAALRKDLTINMDKSSKLCDINLNLTGFEPKSRKLAVLTKDQKEAVIDEESFYVCDANTHEELYEGKIYKGKYLDFTQFEEEGFYYIKVGSECSGNFTVTKGHYSKLLKDRLSEPLKESDPQDEEAALRLMESMTDLLLAFEIFEKSPEKSLEEEPEAKQQDTGLINMISEGANSLLKLYDREGHKAYGIGSGPLSYKYAAILAMTSSSLKDHDKELSGQCLETAEELYKALEKERGKEELSGDIKDALYWASAELYKAKGEKKYRRQFEEIAIAKPEGFNLKNSGYFGSLAYLTSTFEVDLELSASLMENIINDSIESIKKAEDKIFFTPADPEFTEDITSRMRLVILADHISESISYIKSAELYYDYLCGLNISDRKLTAEGKPVIFAIYAFKDSYLGQ
ncbi:MAG: glycoside hydrolase family 9 protein [Lachnospiraceae bacterium]|nr:glycoside hydrolase family 9 protein [Lachnospiraceae bacterium]